MSDILLILSGITKKFRSRNSEEEFIEVLSNINLELKKGEIVGLVSPSGGGKSTLLQIAGLLDRPTEGFVTIKKQKIKNYDTKQITHFRKKEIGFIYQFHHLLPEFSALENISIPQWCCGKSKKESEIFSINLLESVGLSERKNHRPSELSGGEQQRIALCRALANSPSVLLADEPTGNLDSDNSEIILDLIIEKVRFSGLSALIATHDMHLARKMDRIVQISGKTLLDFN
tara:strand:- start:144 stop:836 length:693 start_codon:yes stop_codon:yes gene_type:complete